MNAITSTTVLSPSVALRGDRVLIGNLLPCDPSGQRIEGAGIARQTQAVFERLQDVLTGLDASLADLIRINTYYVYVGPEHDATRYWEAMTEVRLRYFADPGPVGTAVRVAGTAHPDALIQLEVEALRSPGLQRSQRLMPSDIWDWSVPVPLSQGWRHEHEVWIGGQVAADRHGRALHHHDLETQTRLVLRYLGNVLAEAGASQQDLTHLKICYYHDGDAVAAEQRLRTIQHIIHEVFPDCTAAQTAFGVNLLYEGLLLEIDGYALLDQGAAQTLPPSSAKRHGSRIQLGGLHSRPRADETLAAELLRTLAQAETSLRSLGGRPENLLRLNVFVDRQALASQQSSAAELLTCLRSALPSADVATTLTIVEGLPGQAHIQLDLMAELDSGVAHV